MHVGIVGIGRIGGLHASTLGALADVTGVTLTDTDAPRAREAAAAIGATAVESPEALIAAGIDAIVIATPTPTHAPLLRLAADAGLPAFCEKPVALDVAA